MYNKTYKYVTKNITPRKKKAGTRQRCVHVNSQIRVETAPTCVRGCKRTLKPEKWKLARLCVTPHYLGKSSNRSNDPNIQYVCVFFSWIFGFFSPFYKLFFHFIVEARCKWLVRSTYYIVFFFDRSD